MPTVSEHSFKPTVLAPEDKARLDELLAARHALALADAQLRDQSFIDAITDIDERRRARDTFARLQPAILAIDNARIELVVAKMDAHLAALKAATADLKATLARIQKVSALLDTVGRVLAVVGRFVAV